MEDEFQFVQRPAISAREFEKQLGDDAVYPTTWWLAAVASRRRCGTTRVGLGGVVRWAKEGSAQCQGERETVGTDEEGHSKRNGMTCRSRRTRMDVPSQTHIWHTA